MILNWKVSDFGRNGKIVHSRMQDPPQKIRCEPNVSSCFISRVWVQNFPFRTARLDIFYQILSTRHRMLGRSFERLEWQSIFCPYLRRISNKFWSIREQSWEKIENCLTLQDSSLWTRLYCIILSSLQFVFRRPLSASSMYRLLSHRLSGKDSQTVKYTYRYFD